VNATFLWGDSSKLRILGDLIQDDSNAAGGQRLNNFIQPALDDRYDQRTDMPVDRDSFETKGVAATFTQGLGDSLELKVVGAYREGEGNQFIDFDELNNNLFQVPAEYSDDQTSGEVQLTYTGERLKGVAGVYYFDGTAAGAFDASLGALSLTSLTKGSVDTESRAVYADATYALTDKLNVSAGARWSEDKKTATVFVQQYLGRLPADQTLFDQHNVPAGFIPLGVPQSDYTASRTFSDVSPRVSVDYKVTDGVMLYAGYGQGFKSGGFDMRGNALANPATKQGYKPEHAESYEVGMKSTLADDTLNLNLTVFYMPIEDVQVGSQQFAIVNGTPTNVTAVLNAGEQLYQGVELESVWKPIEPLTLVLNVGYLEAEFDKFLIGCVPAAAGCTQDVSSLNSPINAPEWTTFLGATYEWNIGAGDIDVHAGYQYRSATKVANTTASITDQPAYDILDLGVAYTTPSGAWRFSLEGRNILDEEYRVAGYDFGNPPPPASATGGLSQIGFYGPPRTVAVTATFKY
jgi:iron complex outermembrane receptor protein